MVVCAIIGCSNRTGRDKVRFFSLPTIVRNKGVIKCSQSRDVVHGLRLFIERI